MEWQGKLLMLGLHAAGIAWCAFLYWIAADWAVFGAWWLLGPWLSLGVLSLIVYIRTWPTRPRSGGGRISSCAGRLSGPAASFIRCVEEHTRDGAARMG